MGKKKVLFYMDLARCIGITFATINLIAMRYKKFNHLAKRKKYCEIIRSIRKKLRR